MKNLFFFLSIIICFSFVACSDDGDGDNNCSGKTEAISISIENAALSNISGSASISGENISVDIDGDAENNARIFFTAPNTEGTYDLSFDLSGNTESRTVTAYVPADALNIILSTGCYEIVSINDTEVIMRFNINEDVTSINGEITLEVI